jgi:ATP-binding cassette subfamily B protein
LVSCERLAEIEKLPDEDSELLEVKELYGDFSGFEIKDLSFGYGREEVLMDVDLFIPKGKIVCITGSSGSGKSTLFKLLLNVYHPTKGGIFLAGLDEERILSLKERALFAYVPQGNFLFSGTIYENMTFFCDGEVSETQIRDAIETACAQFVYELPDGLNTSLSERGAGLSEGQLQRLALVRALLSGRPVLLLDEATSALDGETETALLENLKKLEDKTCLIVTHRPAALSIADLVLRVEEGKIR